MLFPRANDLLRPGYQAVESGVVDHEDGYKPVCALTLMPRAKAKMVEWWFGWLGGTEQYKLWHPTDHLFSDWEDRAGNTPLGSSHLVHEYLGGARTGRSTSCGSTFATPQNFSMLRFMLRLTVQQSVQGSGFWRCR